MAVPSAYTSNIAELKKANPAWSDEDAYGWGQRYYGWNPSGTGGTTATTTTTTGTTAPTSTLNYMPTPAPAFNAPAFGAAPAWNKPADFTYADFVAPDKAAVLQDPGYQFRLNQGQEALDRSASARGSLRGGGQQRAVQAYGSDLASQEYGKAFERAQSAYDRNYGKARDAYDINYRSALDTYKVGAGERDAQYNAAYQNYQGGYAPQLATWQAQNLAGQYNAEQNWQREFDLYKYQTDDGYRRWRDQMDNDTRWGMYQGDDSFRRYQLEEQRRQFLTSLGAG